MTRRAVLYARQSVEKDGGDRSLSLDTQIGELEARCQREGWRVVETIREAGLKGWMDADERPGLARVIHIAESGGCDVVLVWDLSRLARALWLQEPLIRQLDRAGVQVVSHTEPEATHILMRQIKGAINEERSRDLSRRISSTVLHLQRRGVHHGIVPWGYLRPVRGQPLVLDPEVAPIVRWMYEQRAAGLGPSIIGRALNERGIRTPKGHRWPASTVTNVLAHIAHRGAVRAGEAVIEGAHPAIVDAALWQAAQGRAFTRSPRPKPETSWLEGLIEHACGSRMYLCRPTGAIKARFQCAVARAGWKYAGSPPCPYRPHSMNRVRVEPLAWVALTETLARLPPPTLIVAEQERQYREATPGSAERVAEATARLRHAERLRDRAVELYLAGDIDRVRYDATHTAALAEMAEAERTLASLPAPPDETVITEIWEHLTSLHELLPAWPDEDRATLLREIGVAVLSPAGVKAPGSGAPDAGRVVIRPHADLLVFLGDSG